MKRGTLTLSWHEWRGVGIDRELFMAFVRLGFLTLGATREVIDEKLSRIQVALKTLRGARHEPR